MTKEKILSIACRDEVRYLTLLRKVKCCDNPFQNNGIIKFETDRTITIEMEGQVKKVDLNNQDFVEIYVGALGSLPDWARIQIICPSDNKVLYDSGKIDLLAAFCQTHSRSLFFLQPGSKPAVCEKEE